MERIVSIPIPRPDYGLTPREQDVLALAAQGLTGPQIAVRLGLRFYTMASHMKQIHRKLGVHNRAAAVVVALRLGLVDSPPELTAPSRNFGSITICPRCGSRGNGLGKGTAARHEG
jgi:DNA-binding CsgD family transcriptional regulator